MNRYSLPLDSNTERDLASLRNGVNRLGVYGRAKGLEGVFGCILQTPTGSTIMIAARQQYLEYKFEVFPIRTAAAESIEVEWDEPFELRSPVEILLLQTEDWLDPQISCDGAIGTSPLMQCQGKPDEAPMHAAAACTYFGGVELRGAGGSSLIVGTLPFPYAIHVSAVPRTGELPLDAFVRQTLTSGSTGERRPDAA